jgi:hypothetical protein
MQPSFGCSRVDARSFCVLWALEEMGSIGRRRGWSGLCTLLDRLHRAEATLTFPLAIIFRCSRIEPEERRLEQAANDYTQWFCSRLTCRPGFLAGKAAEQRPS